MTIGAKITLFAICLAVISALRKTALNEEYSFQKIKDNTKNLIRRIKNKHEERKETK